MENQNEKVQGRVRPATMQDVDAVHDLISYYAERNRMLFRTLEDLYERLREFRVFVDDDGKVLGCAGLALLWRDLGEIRSMAVDPNYIGCGIGRKLVEDAVAEGKRLGLKQIFALTYEAEFFKHLGFQVVDKELLPHKVWTDCIHCDMQDNCREIPVLMQL
jgi:amino-acid N-acetyltransferase